MSCAPSRRQPLRVVLTAGPTREPIDPVRFLSNYSTGYMGAQIAGEALRRGHQVTIVCGPTQESMPQGATVLRIETAREMARALRQQARRAEVVIMAAAVSDFRPARRAQAKLSRHAPRTLRLHATPDLIAELPRAARQLVIGFALETHRVIPRAQAKLRAKRLDALLAQQADGAGSPFGRRRVRAWLLTRSGAVRAFGQRTKPAIARMLLDSIESLWDAQWGCASAALHPALNYPARSLSTRCSHGAVAKW